jgi:ABC-type dipeptide/oligopeptide/nickel transport system permease subunit
VLLDGEAVSEGADRLPSRVAASPPARVLWRRLRVRRTAMLAGGLIVVLLVLAVAAPLVVKVLGLPAPNHRDASALTVFGGPTGPSSAHPFGVDQFGRDILSQVVYGARASLLVAILGTAIAALVGTIVGVLAGLYRGWVDTLLMRTLDVFMAFPVVVLGLGIGAACGSSGCLQVGGTTLIDPGIATVTFVVALASFSHVARITRRQVLALGATGTIEAARALGAGRGRIVVREILPSLAAPVIVSGSLLIPQNILLESALSYLGVGVRAPTASWGQMISDAGHYTLSGTDAWWYLVFPGGALVLTVLAFNLLGDGLHGALAPGGTR